MANILNKSNHPVLIKKIRLNIWSQRDELEAAIAKRLAESSEKEPNLEDIKEFYSRLPAEKDPYEDDAEEAEDNENDIDGEVDTEDLSASDEIKPDDTALEVDSESAETTAESSSETPPLDAEAAEPKPAPVIARIRPSQDKISSGFALMSDLNMETFLVFSKNGFYRGQTIVIELLIPHKFTVTAEILRCEDISRKSRIISDEKPNFRLQCMLTYNQPGERSALRDFLKSIEPDIPGPPKKIKKQSQAEDDDEFEDLGF